MIAYISSFMGCSADTNHLLLNLCFFRVQLVRLDQWVSGDTQVLQVPRVNKVFLASLEKKEPR